MILMQVKKDKDKDNSILPEGLDLVEEDEQITHQIQLDEELNVQDSLSHAAIQGSKLIFICLANMLMCFFFQPLVLRIAYFCMLLLKMATCKSKPVFIVSFRQLEFVDVFFISGFKNSCSRSATFMRKPLDRSQFPLLFIVSSSIIFILNFNMLFF